MSADTVGGVWHYALELAAELIAAGDTVAIAAMGGRLSKAQRAAVAAIPGLVVHDSGYKLEWMDAPWDDLERAGAWLQRLAADFRPDIVHLNHYGHGEQQWPAPVLRVAHSCVYSWYHAVLGRAPEPRWQRYQALVRQGLQTADMVAAPSLAMLAQAERFYGPFRHARVIHNGRDPQLFSAGIKQPLILSAGRIWDEAKNIAALARVAPRLPWPVAVAGETRHPDGGSAELPGVQALGSLAPSQLREAFAKAGIYCLPARYEPFGLSVLEAALSGCALVLGDIESLRELWDGAALFVEPGDEEELVQALERLTQDESLRRTYAQRALQHAQRYTTARMVADYRTLYDHLAGRARAPRRAMGAGGN